MIWIDDGRPPRRFSTLASTIPSSSCSNFRRNESSLSFATSMAIPAARIFSCTAVKTSRTLRRPVSTPSSCPRSVPFFPSTTPVSATRNRRRPQHVSRCLTKLRSLRFTQWRAHSAGWTRGPSLTITSPLTTWCRRGGTSVGRCCCSTRSNWISGSLSRCCNRLKI